MDILNFISWIKSKNYRTTLPTDTINLIPIGSKDSSRDDGYLPLAINAAPLQSLYNTVNVTQGTSITTTVTANALNGVITTVASTLAAATKTSFTVNNSLVKANSKILVTLQYDEAATGIPVLGISDVVDGSFKVVIANAEATDPLNALVKIHYFIIA